MKILVYERPSFFVSLSVALQLWIWFLLVWICFSSLPPFAFCGIYNSLLLGCFMIMNHDDDTREREKERERKRESLATFSLNVDVGEGVWPSSTNFTWMGRLFGQRTLITRLVTRGWYLCVFFFILYFYVFNNFVLIFFFITPFLDILICRKQNLHRH